MTIADKTEKLGRARTKVTVNGVVTIIREMTEYSTRGQVHICPLCKQEIADNEKIYFLVNNYKLFPNIFIHKKCCHLFLTNPQFSFRWIILLLSDDFREAERLHKFYRCWYT